MNYLILWKDIRLFVGQNSRPVTKHKHPVIQFVVAENGKFRSRVLESGEWIYKKGLLIRPNHPHICDATNVPIISIDIEPYSALGTWVLSEVLENNSTLDYSSEKFGSVDFDLGKKLLKSENYKLLYEHILEIFRFEDPSRRIHRDERIDKVIKYIHTNIHQTLTTQALKQVSFLSESRLLHLFKEQMGLPIRNYIIWYRLKVAIEQITHGASLTEAAHLAGFSDQSHFTRSCINMIGVPPSSITKNSKFVQVSFLS